MVKSFACPVLLGLRPLSFAPGREEHAWRKQQVEVIFPEGSQLELDAGCQIAILASMASWIALSGVFGATDMNGITRQQVSLVFLPG